jgi:hypothetical protein
MMHRIRGAMQDDGRLLSGLVEMDEKPRKRNRPDDAVTHNKSVPNVK